MNEFSRGNPVDLALLDRAVFIIYLWTNLSRIFLGVLMLKEDSRNNLKRYK